MTQLDTDYTTAWKSYRRIARCGLLLIPGLWVCMVLIGWYVPDSIGTPKMILLGVLAFAWGFSGLIIIALLYGFECPRCKELFFVARLHLNTFVPHCCHCGLKKWHIPRNETKSAEHLPSANDCEH